jgi:hypothetical protein
MVVVMKKMLPAQNSGGTRLASLPGRRHHKILHCYPQLLQENTGYYVKISHDRFHPRSLKFIIIHKSPHR